MDAPEPMLENHLAFMETHRGRIARRSDSWIGFSGDTEFLTFGSPQSAAARGPANMEPTIWLYPWAGEEWAARLGSLGYAPAEKLSYMELTNPGMAKAAQGDIRVVASEEEALDFASVQDRGFITPDSPDAEWWRDRFRKAAVANYARSDQHFYTFYSDSRPLGVLLSVTSGAATGIYAVATDPQFRNRGVSSALLARCCADASDRPIVLQVAAGSYAEGFYSRLGFEERFSMQVWRRRP